MVPMMARVTGVWMEGLLENEKDVSMELQLEKLMAPTKEHVMAVGMEGVSGNGMDGLMVLPLGPRRVLMTVLSMVDESVSL